MKSDSAGCKRPRNVVLLGATGSIGESALRIVRAHPDDLNLLAVAAFGNAEKLGGIVREFRVPHASLGDPRAADRARKDGLFPDDCHLHTGPEGLEAVSVLEEADLILVAVVGTAALKPTLAAIEAGKDIALASKEILVLGGAFVMEAARRRKIRLLPTDSEHNAIFQCLEGHPDAHLDKLILTASGGQFRDRDPQTLHRITPEEATRHPNWSMGPKITVDSATMANKGLELMEARWLFGLSHDRLEVVLHPQSIVHSLVQFIDGSILAQMSPPSMTFAIQHCLLYPERAPGVEKTIDFREAFTLDFAPPPPGRYPCLTLAYEAMRRGGCAPAVYNAANEVAVEAFLENKLPFLDIPRVIEFTLDRNGDAACDTLEDLLNADAEARRTASGYRRAAQP